jgi:aspartate aminotransferase, cytoplasmic
MSQSVPTSFSAEAVPQAPEDPLFGLMAAYRADTFDKKVDLGIGAYRDNDAKPWILPVVKKVIQSLHELEQLLTQSSRQRRSSVMTPP